MKRQNIFRRIILILMSCIFVFFTYSCGETNNSADKNSDNSETNNSSHSSGEIEDSGKFIVKNGTSDYSILIPEIRDENIDFAISELIYGIEQTCDYTMTTTTNYISNKKYISVGDTELYRQNKSVVDGNGIKEDENRIVSIDENVIIIGGSETYTIYSVYDFMEECFGFKWFTYEDAYVEKSNNIPLLNFDYRFIPDLHFRAFHQFDYWTKDVLKRNRRLRLQNFDESCFISGHTLISYILPKHMYLKDHPEWYTRPVEGMGYETTGQLCLTNEEMIEEFIKRCKEIILEQIDNPNKEYFFLGMEDDWDYCKCDKCVAQAKKYNPKGVDDGNRSANFIIFANKVEKAINEWVKTIKPGKTIKFFVYAYFHNLHAPVTKDSEGNFVAVSPDVIPNENISILYAPLNNDFTYSWNDDRNPNIKNVIEEWTAITNNFTGYSYNVPYGSIWLPMNDLLTIGETYGYAKEKGFFGFMEEGRVYQPQFSMQKMKNYIDSQLWWDYDRASVDELAYEFIDVYYKPVADEFKYYYSTIKQWQIHQIEDLGLKIGVMVGYADAKFWPYEVCSGLLNQLDNMIKKLEDLKVSDPEIYDKYFDRINSEKVWIYYTIGNFYKKYYTVEEYNDILDFILEYGNQYQMLDADQIQAVKEWRI